MPKREGHTHIGGMLTDHAASGWQKLVDETGVEVTAVLEVMGRRMAEGRANWKALDEVIVEARKVMVQRKRRRPPETGSGSP